MPEAMSEGTLGLAEKLLNDPKLRDEYEDAWPYGVFRQTVAEVRRLRAQPRCDFPGACPMKEAPDA